MMQNISSFLAENGISLKKSFGQNFLIDDQVLADIVRAAEIGPTDHIVEIGPGCGILTKELMEKAARVTVIELDTRMIPLMKEYVTRNQPFEGPEGFSGPNGKPETRNQLTVINDNALTTPFPESPYKIVANIPYHITSPLLRHAYAESPVIPTSMTLLIQKEVAERICDTKDFGLLSILVRLFGIPRFIRSVPPNAFLPPPAVTSAVIRIDSHPQPLADAKTIDKIFRLTKIAFSQKRKMLRKTLGSLPHGLDLLTAAGINPTRRPQTLTVEEWLRIAACFLDPLPPLL